MVAAPFPRDTRVTALVLLLQVRLEPRISRWRPRPDLLHLSSGADVSYQGQNLRAADGEELRHVRHQRTRELGRPGDARPHDERADAPRSRRLRALGAVFPRWRI